MCTTPNHVLILSDYLDLEIYTKDDTHEKWVVKPSKRLVELWPNESHAKNIAQGIVYTVLRAIFLETPIAFIHTLEPDDREKFLHILEK